MSGHGGLRDVGHRRCCIYMCMGSVGGCDNSMGHGVLSAKDEACG